jgi:hypothetical protein
MKGIILEVTGNSAVVLTQKNDYKKIQLKEAMSHQCGDEIELINDWPTWHVKPIKLYWRQLVMAMILLVIMTFPMMSLYQSNQIAGHINIDINPSIRLTYDQDMRILEVKALNNDGAQILAKKDMIDMTVNEAVDEVIHQAIVDGFIRSEKDNGIIVSLTQIKKDVDMTSLSETIDSSVEGIDSIKIEYIETDKTTFKIAEKISKSPGELVIEECLIENATSKGVNQINQKTTTFEMITDYKRIRDQESVEKEVNENGVIELKYEDVILRQEQIKAFIQDKKEGKAIESQQSKERWKALKEKVEKERQQQNVDNKATSDAKNTENNGQKYLVQSNSGKLELKEEPKGQEVLENVNENRENQSIKDEVKDSQKETNKDSLKDQRQLPNLKEEEEQDGGESEDSPPEVESKE